MGVSHYPGQRGRAVLGRINLSAYFSCASCLGGTSDGQASLADLRRAVAIFDDERQRMDRSPQRLAARAPGLDIFGQSLVIRDATGWRITDAGRALLETLESPAFVASAPAAIEVPRRSLPHHGHICQA